MADTKKLDLGEEKPKKSSKGIIFAILGSVLVTLAAVFGTLYFLGIFPPQHKSSGHASANAAAEHGDESMTHPLIYLSLAPPFAVNYKGHPDVRVVQIEMSVASTDQAILDAITKHSPMIRNNLLLLLSGQDPTTLKTAEGKNALRELIKEAIKKVVIEQTDKKTGVDEVYFTGFVMQ